MEQKELLDDYAWDDQEWGYTAEVWGKTIDCDKCDPLKDETREECRICGYLR